MKCFCFVMGIKTFLFYLDIFFKIRCFLTANSSLSHIFCDTLVVYCVDGSSFIMKKTFLARGLEWPGEAGLEDLRIPCHYSGSSEKCQLSLSQEFYHNTPEFPQIHHLFLLLGLGYCYGLNRVPLKFIMSKP